MVEFKFQVQRVGVVGFPQRGEMFLARSHAIRLSLYKSAITYGALAGRKHISLLIRSEE